MSADGTVVFGAFNFSESTILANIYAQAAVAAGMPAEVVSVGAREVVYPQLFNGQLGVVPEYSGTAVVALGGDATSDTTETHDALVDLMKAKKVAVLDSAPAQDRNALAVTLDTATRLNLQTMTDLAKVAPDLTLGGPAECPQRPLCIPGFESTYGIKFKSFMPLDSGVPTASSLARGDVGAALVFTTDATISPFTLIALDDDKGMFPADNVTPVVRQEVLDKYPQLGPALDKVSAALTTRDVRALNYTVALAGERPDQAAKNWLRDKGLI
jgi:osmoprotectant transport system substrate-binding protein